MYKYISVYKRLTVRSVKTLIEYKIDFMVGIIAFFVAQVLGLLTIKIIFIIVPELNGWHYSEVLLVYSIAQIPKGIDHLLTDNLWILSNRIILRGEFDKYLLRPINPLFLLLAEKFQMDALGEIVIGSVLLIYAISKLNIVITPIKVIFFIFFILMGTAIYFGIKLIFASLAFWFKTSDSILGMIYSFNEFCKYPITIYPVYIRVFISYLLPFAFTAYFPAAFFLHRESMYFCFIVCFVICSFILYVSLKIWNAGIKVYEGSGN